MNSINRSIHFLKNMLLPATQYILHHSCTSKMIHSLLKAPPRAHPKIRRDVRAVKNMDSLNLNGGYGPSYIERTNGRGRYVPMQNWQWYTDSKDSSAGSVRQSGGGIGKLDAANEDGFFFKLNKSRLKKLKQLLKEKGELKRKETPAPAEKK